MHQFLLYNEFIILFYMFRAQPCSSSGVQNCIKQHLASSHSAGGRSMHRLREFIILLYMFRAQPCSKHVEEYNKFIIK